MSHATSGQHSRVLVTIACVAVAALTALTTAPAQAQVQSSPGERPVVGLKYEGPIKAVYQVTSDQMKDGASRGLSALKVTYDGYVSAGVDPAKIRMKAVFHSKAAAHLLTDEAWNRHNGTTGGNPNTGLIAELTRRGIELELCDLARTGNNWAKSDIYEDVTLVGNAYHRLVELQTQGYTYVKF